MGESVKNELHTGNPRAVKGFPVMRMHLSQSTVEVYRCRYFLQNFYFVIERTINRWLICKKPFKP